MKRLKSGSTMKIYHKMYILELNVETWNIKKLIKMTPFHILFKMTLTYQPCFLHYSFIFKKLYKMTLFTAVFREEKNRDIVFREIINTKETRPIFPKGVFCSGVYYTRDKIYKDCYIRQGCSQ